MTDPTRPAGPRPLPGQGGPPVQRVALALVGVVAVVAVSLAAVLARPTLVDEARGPHAPAGAAAVGATGHTTAATVTIKGMAFSPSSIDVPAGDDLQVTVINHGDQRHDLVFANGTGTDTIAPGAQATVDVGVVGADLDGWCSLPGHRQMGMTLTVVAVGAAPSAPKAAMATGTATTVPTMTQLEQATQGAPPYPAALPPLDAATERDYTFTVTEGVQDVVTGLTRAVWTYNGTSPGPILHGRVGDTFHITLVNHGSMGHSIDFHAGELAPDGPMRTIEPGQQLKYTFTAGRAGIWMYHCSTMPMSQHIANGMFGAVVIEPAGLDAADQQYVLIQSEEYLGADAQPADPAKVAAGIPDLVTFNGRAFQYDAHPLTAHVGDRVRIWVLDIGPNASWSFHVVGTQFDTVWTEGAYTVRRLAAVDGPSSGTPGAQVLPLLAAQGGFVEFVPTEAGHYAMVNHQMSLAEKGAHGILAVTD